MPERRAKTTRFAASGLLAGDARLRASEKTAGQGRSMSRERIIIESLIETLAGGAWEPGRDPWRASPAIRQTTFAIGIL